MDRHLKGLMDLAEKRGSLPEFFQHYEKLYQWALRMSTVSATVSLQFGTWGPPVTPKGVPMTASVAYTLKEDRLEFVVTTLSARDSAEYVNHLERALDAIYKMLIFDR